MANKQPSGMAPQNLLLRKPRNPFAAAARSRSAGPHGRSSKAERGHARRDLQRLLRGTDLR